MILPIYSYGHKILRKECGFVKINDNLKEIVENMFETMYNANGVGLAAPQVGSDMNLFIVDDREGFKEVFINPEIEEYIGNDRDFEEGCLSIPGIKEFVSRPDKIKITYTNLKGEDITKIFEGIISTIIQHEYDHTMGILFTDKVSNLKKRLLRSKLEKISKGKYIPDYPMKFL